MDKLSYFLKQFHSHQKLFLRNYVKQIFTLILVRYQVLSLFGESQSPETQLSQELWVPLSIYASDAVASSSFSPCCLPSSSSFSFYKGLPQIKGDLNLFILEVCTPVIFLKYKSKAFAIFRLLYGSLEPNLMKYKFLGFQVSFSLFQSGKVEAAFIEKPKDLNSYALFN